MKRQLSRLNKLTKKPRKARKTGAPPGTLIYTGKNKVEKVEICFFQYNGEHLIANKQLDPLHAFSTVDKHMVNWYNVTGLSDKDFIERMGNQLNVHGLVLEDIMNIEQLPKYEEYEEYLFFCTKMIKLSEDNFTLDQEQISFLLFDNCLVSLQEKPGDLFEPVRDRINAEKGRIRHRDTDYLFYCLIDVIVDNYYLVIDHINDEVFALEEEIINKPSPDHVQRILHLKKMVMALRKVVVPFRESLVKLVRVDNDPVVSEVTLTYFHDVQDHINYILDNVNTAREVLNGCMDLHMANLSNGLNEVMKTLTIISTVFIPLTFIAGIYGMNFQNMPELEYENGYYYALAAMGVIGVIMFIFMKRKNWL